MIVSPLSLSAKGSIRQVTRLLTIHTSFVPAISLPLSHLMAISLLCQRVKNALRVHMSQLAAHRTWGHLEQSRSFSLISIVYASPCAFADRPAAPTNTPHPQLLLLHAPKAHPTHLLII